MSWPKKLPLMFIVVSWCELWLIRLRNVELANRKSRRSGRTMHMTTGIRSYFWRAERERTTLENEPALASENQIA